MLYITFPILILLSLFIYFNYFFSFSSDKGSYRTNQELITYFYEQEASFLNLNQELIVYAKKGLHRIDYDSIRPDDLSSIGITGNNLKLLRKRFKLLGFPIGVFCDDESITYLTHTYGFSITGGAEGFLFSLEEGLLLNLF